MEAHCALCEVGSVDYAEIIISFFFGEYCGWWGIRIGFNDVFVL